MENALENARLKTLQLSHSISHLLLKAQTSPETLAWPVLQSNLAIINTQINSLSEFIAENDQLLRKIYVSPKLTFKTQQNEALLMTQLRTKPAPGSEKKLSAFVESAELTWGTNAKKILEIIQKRLQIAAVFVADERENLDVTQSIKKNGPGFNLENDMDVNESGHDEYNYDFSTMREARKAREAHAFGILQRVLAYQRFGSVNV